jgi:ABC-type transport system substrate-binding protein
VAGIVVGAVGGYLLGQSTAQTTTVTQTKTVTQAAQTVTTTVTQPTTITITQTVTATTTAVATPKLSRVIIAWPFEIVTLHPYKFSRNMPSESPMDAIYDRFLTQDINLKIQPGVIEKYEWMNPEKTRIDFTIRRGIKFHDGTELTAEDVAFSFNEMKKGAYAATWGNMDVIDVASPTLVKSG